MAVTQSTLPTLAFSRNQQPVVLTSNNYLGAAGVNASNYINISGSIANGDTIQLTWGARTITLTAAAVPDDSGKQFPSGNGTTAYITILIPYLQANYYISSDFLIVQSGSRLYLNAKNTGADYTVIPWSAGHVSVAISVNGVTEELLPNFALLLEVYQKATADISLYSNPINLTYPYTGAATKNLSEIVNSYLSYDIPDMASIWQACPNSVMRCYLKYAEIYGDTPEVKKVVQSADLVFCLGGYSNLALVNITGNDQLEKYLLPDPALYHYQRWFETFPLDNFDVKTNQPMFLYFMNMRSVAETLVINVAVQFSNGTSTTITKAGGLLQPLTKAAVAVGYKQLGLDQLTTSTKWVISYQVKLTESVSHEDRSLLKSFTVNRDYEEYTRYILYSDSAGNFKTLRTWGKSKVTGQVTATTSERFEDENTPKTGNQTRYDIYLTESDELNTGYIVGDERLDQLVELALADKAFRVFGDSLVPITITASDSIPFEADGVNLNALKITYQLAYKERLYTGSTGALVVPRLNQSQQALNNL